MVSYRVPKCTCVQVPYVCASAHRFVCMGSCVHVRMRARMLQDLPLHFEWHARATQRERPEEDLVAGDSCHWCQS